MAERDAYRRAGVDVAAGERAVELMRASVESTRRPEVVGGLGGFAGAVAIPAGLKEPLLVSSTDGVGTKTALAARLGRFDGIGIDLVAMCADDVVCVGAEPLFFLDYLAVGRLVPERVAELVASVAAGCRIAGCALVGGETAEHPGLMAEGDFDVAGCCVGVVERDRVVDGSAVEAGDAIVGIASSGLHANGFSLVRAVIDEARLDLSAPYDEVLNRVLGPAGARARVEVEPELAASTLGDVLLTPTRIYARDLLGLRAVADVRAIAHVTGGGLPGNVPRVLPDGLGARVRPDAWPMPTVMRLVGALAGLDGPEIRATFNGGLGMVVVVPPRDVAASLAALESAGMAAWQVGEVRPVDEFGGLHYVEEGERR